MFLAQKQMMARNPMQAEGPMAQQQKIMLYAMPALLAVISFQFPLGVLLYWVTTNFWQVAQQAIILREVKHELEEERRGDAPLSKSATTGGAGAPDKGQDSKKTKPGKPDKGTPDQGPKGAKGQTGKGKGGAGKQAPKSDKGQGSKAPGKQTPAVGQTPAAPSSADVTTSPVVAAGSRADRGGNT
jgi:YidC/Oxa1 family membrane protein insertase